MHKQRILKSVRGKKPRRSWAEVTQTQREHKYQLRLLNPAKLSITKDGETQVFNDKNQIHTISFHKSSPSKDNKGKTPTQGGEICPKKKQESNLSTNTEDYVEKGKEYIMNSCAKTRVIKIDIEHISGKGNM